ncbi:AzlC family ABC transporter permease [Subdoligranulum variabile]|uniref:Azaleucine resistance protein AzlC n=1 Tax=Subdoligranulum variabile DSM 15176 TaxID=411471 RepID=D1PIF1_9FIRM|nr:AzlC family ABC transporter permease [Subdoligranulum variabile]EFB77536.1 putative azaleucine resistance protein AzlC [Subdoligranulum variabile DSM 15176]UWP67212.1 AzlC family ABC transporter permease [Subdoligranulum variabile]
MGKTAKYAFVRSLPVMAGYLVLGLGFGVLLESKGYGVGWALAMSTLIYAGSMQYVAVDLLAGGASLIAAALMTVTVNARHLFYGISMVERYRDAGPAKPYLIFALTDETYSLVCSGEVPDGVDRKRYFFLVSLFDHLYWIAGSVAGALVGAVLPFDSTGIDFSMTALFLVVMTEQWRTTKDHRPALAGLGVSLVCLLVFGAEDFLIPAMIGITLVLTLLRGALQAKEETDDVRD